MPERQPFIYRAANRFYKIAYPIYRPVYSAFKAWTDRPERRVIRQILPGGGVVADVGANIGVYTRFFASCVGPAGVVHAFEPDPENFRRLRAAAGHLPNARLNQLAVADTSGELLLYVSDQLNVDHRAYAPKENDRRSIRVRAMTLDEYFKPGERVDLVKFDIQGFEFHALKGAHRVIAENAQIKLIIEFWPYGLRQAGVHWKDLILMLQAYDMSILQFAQAGLEPFRRESISERPDWYVNLLAYQPSSSTDTVIRAARVPGEA
jgi:FkbM family methyltransferase